MPLLERKYKGQHPLGWGRNSVWAMGCSAHWLWGFIAKTSPMQGICFDRMGLMIKPRTSQPLSLTERMWILQKWTRKALVLLKWKVTIPILLDGYNPFLSSPKMQFYWKRKKIQIKYGFSRFFFFFCSKCNFKLLFSTSVQLKKHFKRWYTGSFKRCMKKLCKLIWFVYFSKYNLVLSQITMEKCLSLQS